MRILRSSTALSRGYRALKSWSKCHWQGYFLRELIGNIFFTILAGHEMTGGTWHFIFGNLSKYQRRIKRGSTVSDVDGPKAIGRLKKSTEFIRTDTSRRECSISSIQSLCNEKCAGGRACPGKMFVELKLTLARATLFKDYILELIVGDDTTRMWGRSDAGMAGD